MNEKKLRLLGLCAAVLLLGALSACAAASPVAITDKDAGKSITLAVGQELTLSLESNVTTGFAWEVAGLNTAVLEQVGEPEYKAPQSGLVGAGGVQLFRFKAKAAGQAELKLNYRRAWEKDVPPAKTFTVTVVVK
jgi:inhibitor of cysteine peptidase